MFNRSGKLAVNPCVDNERCTIRRKVLTEYIYEQYRKHLLRGGSKESDQYKRPLRLRIAVVIGGAGFSCRTCGKIWRERMAR